MPPNLELARDRACDSLAQLSSDQQKVGMAAIVEADRWITFMLLRAEGKITPLAFKRMTIEEIEEGELNQAPKGETGIISHQNGGMLPEKKAGVLPSAPKCLCDLLRQTRERMGWTIQEVQAQTGIHYLIKYETGTQRPSIGNLNALLDMYNVNEREPFHKARHREYVESHPRFRNSPQRNGSAH